MKVDFNKALERADMQHLRSFFLTGKECEQPETEPYHERITAKEKQIYERIKEKYPDFHTYEDIMGEIYGLTKTYTDVFTELGMQIGMRLATQMLTVEGMGE